MGYVSVHDAPGMHVQEHHVFAALDGATDGPVLEGAVGAGTGMIAFEFKGMDVTECWRSDELL